MSIAEKLTSIAEKQIDVYNAGKQAEYDAFWNSLQQSGNRTDYTSGFVGESWNDTTFKPKYRMTPSVATTMFNKAAITDLVNIISKQGVTLDTSKATSLQNMFTGCSRITKVPKIDASGVTSETGCAGIFNSCVALNEIEEFVFNSNITNYLSFAIWCDKLKKFKASGTISGNIVFDLCPLDKASITSIVEHLSSTSTGKTATFKKTAKEAAFTDDEWAALIATKTNWTFSLI